MSKTNTADMQMLVNVEKIQFADQTQTFSFDDRIKAIVGTYNQLFGRQADLAGEQFWVDAIKNKGLTLGQMAIDFMHSAEQMNKIGFDLNLPLLPFEKGELRGIYLFTIKSMSYSVISIPLR